MGYRLFVTPFLLALLLSGCLRSSSASGDERASGFCVEDTYVGWFPDYSGAGWIEGYRPDDPLFVYQWHLKNFAQQSGPYRAQQSGEDMNVTAVWDPADLSITGRGVVIAVVDSGLDWRHGDLKVGYAKPYSWNYSQSIHDPTPLNTDENCAHGTAVAGIAAARKNGMGVVGVAPGALLAGLNVGLGCGFGASLEDYRDALSVESEQRGGALSIDIFTNSWGLSQPEAGGISQPELDAMREGAKMGRGGKGAIYLFASGNARSGSKHNANYFNEQNRFHTLSIAALGSDGCFAPYSNPGANVLVSAYGGGSDKTEDPTIVTTDLAGCDRGFSANDPMPHILNATGGYTHWMNGTSAATPMVAGVAALMLDANAELTWRDVRYLLATTARQNCSEGAQKDWARNAAGHWVSHDYGFGAVDAYSAVKAAKYFEGLAPLMDEIEKEGGDFSQEDPMVATVAVNQNMLVEFVQVAIAIDDNTTQKRVSPHITLISPGGTRSLLSDGAYQLPPNFFDQGWRFGSVRHLDETSQGEWRLEIKAAGNVAHERIKGWDLILYGREIE